MSYTLLLVALMVAAIDWLAVWKRWKIIEYFAKPGVMFALLAWLWSVSGFGGPLVWFALGLFFSLAGDIFLMLPREQFIAGLVSFLLAHIAYLIGFNQSLPPLNIVSLVLAILVGVTAVRIYRGILQGLIASGKMGLRIPVFLYSIVISLMLISALLTLVRPEWSAITAITVSVGALLFFTSDTILAWSKFVQPVRFGPLKVIITYHLGQILLVVGAAVHYLIDV